MTKSEADAEERQFELDRRELQTMYKLARRAQMNPASIAYFRGCLLHAKGEYQQALAVLKSAGEVQAYNQPSLRQKIAECHIGRREWSQATAQFQEILEMDPVNAQAHLGLAQCQLGENRPRQSYASAASALGLVYHNPKAHFLAGKALYLTGHTEKAISHLETALQQNHVFPECHRLLEEIFKRRGNHTRADEHRRLASAAQLRLDNFKSGHVLPEDTDLQLDITMHESIGLGTTDRREMKNELESQPVIVVSGLPRSGTSMMMQMLAAGGIDLLTDDHRSADPSNPRGYFEFDPAKKLGRQNDWVEGARGKAVKIVAQLLPNLPAGNRYEIIFMARPFKEIIASQSKMLDQLGRTGATISDRRLASNYKTQIKKVAKALARHGELAAITIDYADAVSSPMTVARRVNEFLGGKLDETAMAAAVIPTMRHEKL